MATLRQKMAAQKLVENGGIVSRAMRDAGYSEQTAKSPKKLTERKGFQEYYNELITPQVLVKKHNQLLNSKVLLTMNVDPEFTDKEISDTLEEADCKFLRSKLIETTYTNKKGQENTVTKKAVFYSAPNSMTQQRVLDMSYKLAGHYAPEKKEMMFPQLAEMSDEDLDRALEDQQFMINRFKKYGKVTEDNTTGESTKQKERKTVDKKRKKKVTGTKRQLPSVARRTVTKTKKTGTRKSD